MRRWSLRGLVAGLALTAAWLLGFGAAAQPNPPLPRQVALPTAASLPAAALAPASTLSHGLFSDVRLFKPSGAVRQVVLLLSPRAAPDATEQSMLQKMTAAGALVAFIPIEPFYRRLEAQDGKCTYAGGAFENLSRHLQAFEQLPTYLLPMLVGTGSAASYAYAVLAQTPAGVFGSVLSIGFCPQLAYKTPPCANDLLRWRVPAEASAQPAIGVELLPAPSALAAPWTLLQVALSACAPGAAQAFAQRVPEAQWIGSAPAGGPGGAAASSPTRGAGAAPSTTFELPPAFDAAYAHLASRHVALAPPPAQLANLPIVELPVAGAGTRFAVLLSGDGGWASIDKGIAAAFVAQGIPVAGFDSLRYFWSARTPDGLAGDLDRVIRYYAARWNRKEVILIGYSQGADVLPFAINRLPSATRSLVRLTALLGLGQNASFEFHLGNWIGASGDVPIAPEARRLSAAGTICLYGQTEPDSLCPALAPEHVRAIPLAGGHHFGGDYDALAKMILRAAPAVGRP